MLEKQIEDVVCRYARSYNMLAMKFNSAARAAVPDRLFIHQGTVFFIEFKASGKRPTEAQQREHARFRGHEMTVFVVDDINTGKHIIDMIVLGINPQDIHNQLSEDLRIQ